MQITGLLLKAKIGRYLMRNGGGLDANIQLGTKELEINTTLISVHHLVEKSRPNFHRVLE